MLKIHNLQTNTPIERQLLHEGWSLHQRLQSVIATDTISNGQHLECWRELVAPDNPANFKKRLSWDHLTPSQAAWALDPPTEATPLSPNWWPLLEALRQAARDASGGDLHQQLSERCSNEVFVHAWRPVAAWSLNTLKQRCTDLQPLLQLDDESWLDLAAALLERLCNTADQALWELFNQRRSPGQMLLAHLGASNDGSGEPVHQAYDAFIAELLDSGYALLLTEFPVLGRLLTVLVELWLDGSEEMLRRLAASRPKLLQYFGIAPEAILHGVQLGLSDPHRGGRAVAILRFGDVDVRDFIKVVYKPKDMQVDQTYQDFLQTLNNFSDLPPLRCLTVLQCDGYGFMEWVEHRPCNSDDELSVFYTNAGRTMAVLHILGCTDCHYENLIASDDQLILIDTETLLEADLKDLINDEADELDLFSDLQTSMRGSVLRSGLLPQWLMVGAGKKQAFDISALGIQPPPPERKMPSWLGLNSDGMMASNRSQPCELPTSLPVELGSPQRLTDFIEQLCDGFSQQLQEVMRLRTLLSQALERFSGKPRRLVARATRLYFTIQRQMLEPASLRSAVAHGLKLEQLSRSFLLASEKPLNWPIFKAELLQMERLDIPFFEHLIDSEELLLPEGLAPITGFMKASGLEAAQLRLRELDTDEIVFQQQLIRGAIAARHLKVNTHSNKALNLGEISELQVSSTSACATINNDVYRQEAFRLGEELWAAAIRDRKGRPEWLGMDLGADGESFHFGLIGNSLYSGASGIALLFARLALASPNPAVATQWRERAWSCFAALADIAGLKSNEQLFRLMRDLPYGISGSGGILLALLLLGQAGIVEARTLANQLVQQLRPERLLTDESIDVVGGVSGLIGPLLLLGTKQGQDLAKVCGDRLLALQIESGGWSLGAVTSNKGQPALTGFSHGAAGMAAALARLAQSTGQQRFGDAARRAVAYERSVFVNDAGNWPDFRNISESNEFMLSWCHGAPGILLSRQVLMVTGLVDDRTASELQIARSTTVKALKQIKANGGDSPSHLCCGVLGLTALLRIDAAIMNSVVDAAVPKAEALVIDEARACGGYTFFNIDNGSLNLPGLLTGKAGVALALLEKTDGQFWMPQVLSAGLLETAPEDLATPVEEPPIE